MNTIEKYKLEIETELDHVREKLVELKSKIRGFSDAERLDSIQEVEELEQIADEMRIKLKELNVEMEDSFEQIKGDIDSSRSTIDEAFARLNRSLV